MNTPSTSTSKQIVCTKHGVVRALCAGQHVPTQRDAEQVAA